MNNQSFKNSTEHNSQTAQSASLATPPPLPLPPEAAAQHQTKNSASHNYQYLLGTSFSQNSIPERELLQDSYRFSPDSNYYQEQGTWTIDPITRQRVPFLPQIEALPSNEIPGTYNFFRIPRSSINYRWWRPFIVAIMIFLIFLAFSIVAGIILGIIAPGETLEIYEQMQSGKLNPTPEIMLLLFASVALLLPAIFIGQLFGKWEKLGYISSVAGRIRWRWFGICVLATLIPFGIITAINFYYLRSSGEFTGGPALTRYNLFLIGAIFLVIPIQSAAEEYLYRGFLGQAIGHWARSPILAILVPIPFFVFSHNYDSWAMLSVAYIALLAGILTWWTGGLEAGIALHAMNNLTSTLIFFFVKVVDLQTSGTIFDFFVQSFAVTCAAIAIIFLAKLRNIENSLVINSEINTFNLHLR